MFSKPTDGWCRFSYKSFRFHFSYLEDTPQDFIDQLTTSLNNHTTFSIMLDGEGRNCMIASDRWTLFIIEINDRHKTRVYHDFSMIKFVQEFIDDMEKYEKEFSHWQEFTKGSVKKYNLYDLKVALTNYKFRVNTPRSLLRGF